MGRLTGKIALVTGASRGIGRAIAIALAREGAAIAVNYRSSETEAQRVVEELSSLGVKTMLAQANVGNGTETRAMVKRVVDAWGATVDLRAQYLAQQGFAVFKLDNRGSANRGLAS